MSPPNGWNPPSLSAAGSRGRPAAREVLRSILPSHHPNNAKSVPSRRGYASYGPRTTDPQGLASFISEVWRIAQSRLLARGLLPVIGRSQDPHRSYEVGHTLVIAGYLLLFLDLHAVCAARAPWLSRIGLFAGPLMGLLRAVDPASRVAARVGAEIATAAVLRPHQVIEDPNRRGRVERDEIGIVRLDTGRAGERRCHVAPQQVVDERGATGLRGGGPRHAARPAHGEIERLARRRPQSRVEWRAVVAIDEAVRVAVDADRAVGQQRVERRVGDVVEGDVVDVPAWIVAARVGPDPEPDQDVLSLIGGPQAHRRRDERRIAGADLREGVAASQRVGAARDERPVVP